MGANLSNRRQRHSKSRRNRKHNYTTWYVKPPVPNSSSLTISRQRLHLRRLFRKLRLRCRPLDRERRRWHHRQTHLRSPQIPRQRQLGHPHGLRFKLRGPDGGSDDMAEG